MVLGQLTGTRQKQSSTLLYILVSLPLYAVRTELQTTTPCTRSTGFQCLLWFFSLNVSRQQYISESIPSTSRTQHEQQHNHVDLSQHTQQAITQTKKKKQYQITFRRPPPASTGQPFNPLLFAFFFRLFTAKVNYFTSATDYHYSASAATNPRRSSLFPPASISTRLDHAAVDQKKLKGGAAKNVVLLQSYCTYTGNSEESWLASWTRV